MTSPSSTAGKACVDCGIPDPCILDVITDFPENKEKHTYLKEWVARFKLLDKGYGCKGIINIICQCGKTGEHDAWLEEASENHTQKLKLDGSPNNVTLHYNGQKSETNIIDAFRSPWEYLSSITTPFGVFDEPAHYTVMIDGCYQGGRYVEIDVHPIIEIRFTTGFSYDITSSKRERTIKERRDERVKAREVMNDTKPKNKNKLRDGWTNTTTEFEWSNKTALTVELGVKIGNVEYTHKYEEEIKKLRQMKTLEQLRRVDALVENISKYFAPDPENKENTREYSLFSAKIEPTKIGISYAYQYIDIEDGPCHFYGLMGKPFLEAKFKFDIISFICAYCKVETLVNRCREYLSKHGTSVECYIEISTGINLNLGAVYAEKDSAWDFNIPKKNQIYLGLKGVVSATFEAEVFVVKLAANTKATIGAAAGFDLDPHNDGLDLALYHDGIKGTFEFIIDVYYKPGSDNKKQRPKKENKVKEEWLLCTPLKASNSPLRINLYGKMRPLSKPVVTSPAPIKPWAMGTNPDWNNNEGNYTGYNDIPHPYQ
ncbi:hypothetical protein [Enterobacter sp. RHBSTW-00175]|uniref:hypothetical protein n=1 Tax=Enterobacter sp. RHBSTW-00175 TaxID=2742639 RepID=UPI0021754759|nr:hypothetical protein [Enterobacter sp. RHBSTW-00175]